MKVICKMQNYKDVNRYHRQDGYLEVFTIIESIKWSSGYLAWKIVDFGALGTKLQIPSKSLI